MNELENICKRLSSAIDGIISVSLVNIKDGSVLADCYLESNGPDYKSSISDTVMNIFKNPSVHKVENFLSNLKGEEIKDPFKEIFISSNSNLYFMRLLEELEIVLFVISRKTINQGLIWSEIKRASTEINGVKI